MDCGIQTQDLHSPKLIQFDCRKRRRHRRPLAQQVQLQRDEDRFPEGGLRRRRDHPQRLKHVRAFISVIFMFC